MKILVVSHACAVSLNRRLFAKLNSLPGAHVMLVIPDRWRNEYTGAIDLPACEANGGLEVHRLPVFLPGSVSLHGYLSGLSRTLSAFGPDVVFLDEEPWSIAAAQVARVCQRLGIRLVCYTKQNIHRRYPMPFRWIERQTYRTSAAIFALTDDARALLRQKGFSGPCPVIPHGYDPAVFFPGREEALRQSLGLNGTVIGYLGRFVPVKGLMTLINSVKTTCEQRPDLDIKVLMVGSGEQEDFLRAEIARHDLQDRFVLPGPVHHADAGAYLRCMDVAVLPSVTLLKAREQFGRVVIEAMACGVPVVGSSSGNIPHLVRDNHGGRVFAEGNISDLSHTLLELIDNPETRAALGKTGASSVNRRYTLDTVANDLYQALTQCCGPKDSTSIEDR